MMENPRAPVVPYEKCPLGYILYDDINQDKDDTNIVTSSSSSSSSSIGSRKEITIKLTTTNEKGIKKSRILTTSLTTTDNNDDTSITNIKNVLSYYNYTSKDIIKLYNKAILLLKKDNKAMDSMNVLLPLLYYWINMHNNKEEQKYDIHLSCHVIFLLLDCILQSYRGYYNGLPSFLPFHHCISKNINTNDHNDNNNNSGYSTSSSSTSTTTTTAKKRKKNKGLVGNNTSNNDNDNVEEEEEVEISGFINIDDILDFMEKMINEECITILQQQQQQQSSSSSDTTNITSNQQHQDNEEYINELKFRWHLYKARIVLLQKQNTNNNNNSNNNKNIVDKTRYLKKELKSALELYHHKLRIVENKTSTSPSSKHEQKEKEINSIMNFVTHHRNPILQNQIALYIKANHENESNNNNNTNTSTTISSNNPKRSLKLCMEARRLATQMLSESNDDLDNKEEQELLEDSIYYNNLGIIHMNSGKIHMAYIYYTKAVSHICSLYNKKDNNNNNSKDDNNKNNIITNNNATIPVCEILHNASIVALQAKQYYSAYYYMAKCIQLSPNVFAKRSRCWLRLAEAVIGYYNTKKEATPSMNKYSLSYNAKSSPDYIPRIISYTTNLLQNYDYENEPYLVLSPVLGDKKDLEQLEEIPLLRALFSLRAALRTCPTNDKDCFQTIHLHMAYCHLESNEYISSLHSSNVILLQNNNNDDNNTNHCCNAITKRRRITARLYACESLCYLGKVQQALHLFHSTTTTTTTTTSTTMDKNNDSFLKPNMNLYEQYANDLSMNEEEKTKEEQTHQRRSRLKDATSVIHIACSAIYAFYNDIAYTEEYALSALHHNAKTKNYHDHLLVKEKQKMTTNNDESKDYIVPEDIKVVALRNILYCLFQKEQWDDVRTLLHDLLHTNNKNIIDGGENEDNKDKSDERSTTIQEEKK